MLDFCFIKSPPGLLEIKGNSMGIFSISFVENNNIMASNVIPKTLCEAVVQLNEYFNSKRTSFDIKMNPKGTDFQKKVWSQLQTIPHGKTVSYQHIANQLGNPKVIRAAASANGKNPIAIIIPCHRVIGSDGSLTGYAGGLYRKKWLLEHESQVIQTKLF